MTMRLRNMSWAFVRDHVWTRRHLDAYLEGELDPDAQDRVERHTHLCPPCHRLVETLRATLTGLHGLREQAPAGAHGDVAEAVIGRLRDSA